MTTLENGIRVLHIEFADSDNVSIFTFLPLGLAHDEPGRSQWAHVLEHLVLNSTGPIDYRTTNAETQPDHMRLDFYGTTENWLNGFRMHELSVSIFQKKRSSMPKSSHRWIIYPFTSPVQ